MNPKPQGDTSWFMPVKRTAPARLWLLRMKMKGSLPTGFDRRSSWKVWRNRVIIAHPEHNPHVWDMQRGVWVEMMVDEMGYGR